MQKAAPRRTFPKKSYETLASFRQALRRFLAFSEQAAEAAGLSPQQYQALLAIKGAPGRSELGIREIADRLMIRHHTAVELVDRLEKNGFVARARSKTDARRVEVRPTAKTEQIMNRLAAAHLRELKGIRPALEHLLALFDDPAAEQAADADAGQDTASSHRCR
jgi:DNA-binding MarR family transcriptional regulator